MARNAKKPLLIDFETDWSSGSKYLDYYTYPDAEVATWLEKFMLVKWNTELDSKNVSEQFNLKRYPYIAIIDGDGKLVYSIQGWKKPSEFVPELKAAHEKWLKSSPPDPR